MWQKRIPWVSWFFLALMLIPNLNGCTPVLCPEIQELPDHDIPTHLVLGDSILAWNSLTCQDITDFASLSPVINSYFKKNAFIGARLSNPYGIGDIRSLYEDGGAWEWVVINGGANDLRMECTTNTEVGESCDMSDQCWQIVDDLEQEMAQLIEHIQNDGPPETKVVIIGYYPLPEDAQGGFAGCNSYLLDLNSRYASLAHADPDVYFMDTSETMDYELYPERFTSDLVHPTPTGSEELGKRLVGFLPPEG